MAFPRNTAGKQKAATTLYTYDGTLGAIGSGTYLTNGGPYGISVLSGALTANTYKELLTLNTPGVLLVCAAGALDATSRTIGIKIEIDGVTALDLVSGSISTANVGVVAVGHISNTSGAVGNDISSGIAVPFNTLRVWLKSSLTETDKVHLVYKAYLL